MKMKKRIYGLSLMSLVVAQGCFAQESSSIAGENLRKEITTPESLLPAGVDDTVITNPFTGESGHARKGTVGATLNNIALLNRLMVDVKKAEDEKYIQEILASVKTLIPSLKVIGVFDVFNLEEWVRTTEQPGRVMVALLYLQKYPEALTPGIKNHLEALYKTTKLKMLKDALSKTL